MKSKKHRQHKGVQLNAQRGLNVGGIVIPYWPSYWNGVSTGDEHHGVPTSEGAGNDSSAGTSDGGAGTNS